MKDGSKCKRDIYFKGAIKEFSTRVKEKMMQRINPEKQRP